MTIKHSRIRNTYINKLLQRSIKFFFWIKMELLKISVFLRLLKQLEMLKSYNLVVVVVVVYSR